MLRQKRKSAVNDTIFSPSFGNRPSFLVGCIALSYLASYLRKEMEL